MLAWGDKPSDRSSCKRAAYGLIFLRFIASYYQLLKSQTMSLTTKCLVTGGAGFIGSNLAEELIKQGAKVNILDSLVTGFRENLDEIKGSFEFFEGDLNDDHVLLKAIDKVDIVFHQAIPPSSKLRLKATGVPFTSIPLDGLDTPTWVGTTLTASSLASSWRVGSSRLTNSLPTWEPRNERRRPRSLCLFPKEVKAERL